MADSHSFPTLKGHLGKQQMEDEDTSFVINKKRNSASKLQVLKQSSQEDNFQSPTKNLHVLFNQNDYIGCDASHIVLQKFPFANSDAHFIVKCLGQAIQCDRHPPRNGIGMMAKEGIAGSTPLLFLEQSLAHDEDGNLVGRWRDNFWKTQDVQIFWAANDVDYYVIASDQEEFFNRVECIMKKLASVLKTHKRSVYVEKKRKSYCFVADTYIWIVDCKITGVHPTLSFVHAKGYSSMKEALLRFDMNIVKVMYDVETMMLLAHKDTINDVVNAEATVRDFDMSSDIPTEFEIKKVHSTLKRMVKCGARGYKFKNYPILKSTKALATVTNESGN